ncbi:MAG: HAMP domain-containing histidine kinase [Rhodospirillales bacterium]|nr:HAMP domain-containing histidine kinase [Rhodospirillales bacterium]
MIGSHRAAGLPLTLIAATPAHRLRELALVYFAGVALVGVLALIVGLAGLARVVDGVSARLATLGASMEALARGDYTRRLPRGPADEVGRLMGYFNLMAGSLDEAHRQVKEKAANLRAALENQRQLDRAKDEFLVLISHEVRTPLTAILGGVSYLKSTVKRADPADRDVLARLNLVEIAEVIASSGERLNGFMTDAIQMTAIQTGVSRLELAPVPPRELLAPGLERVGPWAHSRGITVENRLAADVGWQVLCDRGVLQVAVQKILDNAVVHNLDGGRVVVREIDAVPGFGPAATLATPDQVQRLREQPGWLPWSGEQVAWRLLEIHNTGRAIPRHRLDALFGKFELVGRIEHHSRGSGLSLPIAKAAVEQHGGRILVRSEEGWGTAFYLLLPTLPAVAGSAGGLWDDAPQGVGRRTGHEQVGVAADRAGLEVELDHHGAARAGDGDQAGGGPDGARSADHEEHLTV